MKNNESIITVNRKARYDYLVLNELEVGIELLGSEVKSCIAKNVSVSEAYCIFRKNQLFLVGAHIAVYSNSSYMNHNPLRERRLLAHKEQILKMKKQTEQKGLTIVPIDMHIAKNGKIKLHIAVCRGKNSIDKRESIKERDNYLELKRLSK